MSIKINSQPIKRKNPINRNNLYLSEEEVNLQMMIGMEYVNRILNQTVVLYEVDLEKTRNNTVYRESKFEDIHFKTPIELNVIFKLNPSELKTYDTSSIKGYYVKVGQLEFYIYQKELEENGLQVTPEHMEYFIVADDGRVNYDNHHTVWGTSPFYRTIKCTPVSDIKETKNL